MLLGFVVVALALLAWGGQATSWFAPTRAVRMGLREPEDAVDPVFGADIEGEARWDTLTLWTMVVAGGLLIVDNAAWAYFGLVGGGMFVYFGGRGIATRRTMQRRGHRIGTARNVSAGYALLTAWGVLGLITIAVAVAELTA